MDTQAVGLSSRSSVSELPLRVMKGAMEQEKAVIAKLLEGVAETPKPSIDPNKGQALNIIA